MRLVEAMLSRRGAGLEGLLRGLFGEAGYIASASMPRRARAMAKAAAVTALTLSFGIGILVLQETYDREKRLDAQYLVGSDLRVTPALNCPQGPGFARDLEVPGVRSVTGVMRDTQALVGMEKNTVYGIDVASFRRTAYLPDGFFVDGASPRSLAALRDKTTDFAPGKADRAMDALAATPNGVIISVEQAQKYDILIGDPVSIKLFNRYTGEYRQVEAKAVGLFTYFPTSSQDSDFILNAGFMASASGNANLDSFLVSAGGDEAAVRRISEAIGARFKNRLPLRIQDTRTVVAADSSSLASLDLGGLGLLELAFSLAVATVGLAIFMVASVNERKREFGVLRAIGADLGQLGRVLFAESLTIGMSSLALGALVGMALSALFVSLLSPIFTIPPQGLGVPAAKLGGFAAAIALALALSTLFSARRLGRIRVVEAIREL